LPSSLFVLRSLIPERATYTKSGVKTKGGRMSDGRTSGERREDERREDER